MKLKKIFAGMAAATIAASAMAMCVSAADAGKGPNNDDAVSVFGLYIAMTQEEGIANGVLQEDGKEPEDWSTIPVKVTIDEIKFDDNVVTPNGDAFIYWQGDEFKIELVNVYNDKCNGGKSGATSVFSTLPQSTIEVTFTVDGLTSGLAGKAYVGGGFQTGGHDWSSTFFGNKPDETNPAGTTFEMPDITGNGTYTAKVAFPTQGGTDDSNSNSETPSESTGDTSKTDSNADSKSDSKTSSAASTTSKSGSTGTTTTTSKAATSSAAASDNTAETGATAGIALAGIALAGAAIVVSKRK